MRFGNWRGMPLWLSLSTALGLGLGLVSSARADGLILQHTIPREVDAYNFTTGGAFNAPPVPFGHYAKDSLVYGATTCLTCRLQSLMGMGGGHSWFHNHDGAGQGHGDGCGHNWFGHGHGDPVASDGVYAETYGAKGWGGAVASAPGGVAYSTSSGHAGYATTMPLSTAQTTAQPSGQSICGQAGCHVGGRHSHLGSLLGHGGCASYGDPGCGHSGGHFQEGAVCSHCGGAGCSHCLGGHQWGAGLHGKLASLAGGLRHPKVQWFLGAGGPVPLTPGYVPYIVVTRSPRDFLSFAPFNPNAP